MGKLVTLLGRGARAVSQSQVAESEADGASELPDDIWRDCIIGRHLKDDLKALTALGCVKRQMRRLVFEDIDNPWTPLASASNTWLPAHTRSNQGLLRAAVSQHMGAVQRVQRGGQPSMQTLPELVSFSPDGKTAVFRWYARHDRILLADSHTYRVQWSFPAQGDPHRRFASLVWSHDSRFVAVNEMVGHEFFKLHVHEAESGSRVAKIDNEKRDDPFHCGLWRDDNLMVTRRESFRQGPSATCNAS